MSDSLYTAGGYLENNPTWHKNDSPWKAEQILKMMRQNQMQPRKICEVGCGAGEVLRHVHQKIGGEVQSDGFEISQQAIDFARTHATPNLRFHLQDVIESPVSGFDLVLLIDVVEHIEDCFGFLRNLRGTGRSFILHFPLDMNVQMVARRSPILHLRKTVGHLHYFMKDTVLALLRECGYIIDDFFYTPTDLALPAQSRKSALARVPRRLLYALAPDLAVRLVGGFSLLVLAHPGEKLFDS